MRKLLNSKLKHNIIKGEQKQKERRKLRKERTQTLYACDFPQTQECGNSRPVVRVEFQSPTNIGFVTTTKLH